MHVLMQALPKVCQLEMVLVTFHHKEELHNAG